MCQWIFFFGKKILESKKNPKFYLKSLILMKNKIIVEA